jgi:hypothetical protein
MKLHPMLTSPNRNDKSWRPNDGQRLRIFHDGQLRSVFRGGDAIGRLRFALEYYVRRHQELEQIRQAFDSLLERCQELERRHENHDSDAFWTGVLFTIACLYLYRLYKRCT